MTAKQVKSKAPFFWQAVEDAVYQMCKKEMRVYLRTNRLSRTLFMQTMNDAVCRKVAHYAASIATSEFVSRAKK